MRLAAQARATAAPPASAHNQSGIPVNEIALCGTVLMLKGSLMPVPMVTRLSASGWLITEILPASLRLAWLGSLDFISVRVTCFLAPDSRVKLEGLMEKLSGKSSGYTSNTWTSAVGLAIIRVFVTLCPEFKLKSNALGETERPEAETIAEGINVSIVIKVRILNTVVI